MKSLINSIRFILFFRLVFLLSFFLYSINSFSQGFNNNEWIFGECPTGEINYLSFGKGGDPIVRNLPQGTIVGQNNNAVAIDPISGNIIFYSNGVLVYDANNQPLEGMAPGINGNIDGRQELAIGVLDYDPEGDRLYYIFYISPSGELQYALVDMNAPGQATGNEPPLGEMITKDITVSNAEGAILVVKTPQSPSYLISFEGGNLVSRRLGDNEGEFVQTSITGLSFTPKAMIFDESSQKVILIPENPGQDIQVIDFDTSSGTFGSISDISQSGGTDSIEGASFSPDGDYIYYSRGDQLFRVPSDDLEADPELVPLESDIFKIYDVKVGPDGKLYYIYEELDGGPQLVGRVENPDEEELDEIELEEDPFDGTDFCGRIFPQFAPNQDISPTVDFTWTPEQPCGNNPIQLTSEITPTNFRPVSFEWTFTPPLVDEEGDPIDIDFTQEHLLIPEEATGDESIEVTLTVTFADGSTLTVNKTIELIPNDLQVQFSAQDTTVCEGPCVDIGSLLEVQQGDGQGEQPGQGGQTGNYEYFWSNIREWRSDKNNCVDLPGLYWVLVREPGSECYAYGSIRVRIWDLDDQSNNVWYFGDGAGLDFNPDPNDPNAPVPRPVGHNQNIPAGTTTISDETGQVLFFTDGESVWDLNGNLMENGEDIGGSNQSSQSVIAVPVPQDETIFYLFTTQQASDGTNEVKFSVVDIKVENPTGVGNVVSKDNFLFSPSTEHSAALASGDTTWVLFHELGNNTFRAYPVSTFGIGSPVFSSVGSNHGFNTGVGTMKFSPDGNQVAVTIQDGSCSRLEIFDFNQNTGRMTEYALLDLGCNNEEIYGLEFSNDGSRVYVSYRGAGGKVEEFLIKAPENDDEVLACATCFENASNRAAREACILNSAVRNVLSSSGPFGALQIGPDGQIYVARPGQNVLGSINPGQDCNNSNYNENGTSTLLGTTNLGLPSFVQQSGSSIPDPMLVGPDRLCLDPDSAEALFEGGGEPDIDSYFWTITHEDGTTDLSNFGGPGEDFQNLEHVFNRPGNYTVELRVDRCGNPEYAEFTLEILVVAPPELTLPQAETLCLGTPISLTAIDGYDPAEGLYDFEWRNAAGQLFGDENSNTIFVNEESIFTVTVSYRRPADVPEDFFNPCPASASVFVGPAFEFELTQSAEEVCYDESLVVFAPDTPVSGEWFYQIQGTSDRVPLGEFYELQLIPSSLPSPGIYEIIFVTEDPILDDCLVEKILELLVWPLPAMEAVVLTEADDCVVSNGSFEVTMLSDADLVSIIETGQSFTNVFAGDVLPVFNNLEPGIYSVRATSDFGCEFILPVVIQNLNPPIGISEYDVDLAPETCSDTGVNNGELTITFTGGPQSGFYRLIREEDGQQFSDTFTNTSTLNIPLEGGSYLLVLEDELGCAVTDSNLYIIDIAERVTFSVPTDLSACGEFLYIPQGTDELEFTVIGPNGNPITQEQDGSFILEFTGIYTFQAFDPEGILCPSEIVLVQVQISDPIDFSLTEPEVDCDLGVSYSVALFNFNPNNANFFWRDDSGQIVGRDQRFFPPGPGTYSIEVQPRNGGLCPTRTIEFEVEEFIDNVELELDALPFCAEDAFTVITAVADFSLVTAIDWFRVEGNNRIPLPDFEGLESVTVLEDGIYQLVLTSVYGCELAREQIQITQSFVEPPVLLPSYTICAVEEVVVQLDPGEFSNYSWTLDGNELSIAPTFTPTLPGEYELTVSDDLGCEFIVNFTVIEDCSLRVIFPDAMVPSDPNKQFIVYTNDFIDDLEVFIFNRWGELIFYCERSNINGEVGVCSWDGVVYGQVVPTGVYPVVVKYTSRKQNITDKVTKSILVID
jgi:large repetitive protein